MNSDKFQRKPASDTLFGSRPIIEAIKAGREVDRILIQKGLSNELLKELIDEARAVGVPIATVPVEKLNRVTRKNHQGAIAFMSSVVYSSLDNIIESSFSSGKEPFILILDRITDVRNMGAIARTAECAGVDAIVVPSRGGAQISSDAMKTSAGALNHIPVCRAENLKDTIVYLKNSGITVISCTEKTDNLLYEVNLTGPLAVIMGSEEDGISGEYLKLSDLLAKIPLAGKIESLNVAVSAGVILYETLRQRGL